MPIREYVAKSAQVGCPRCLEGFERLEGLEEEALWGCPDCGAPIKRVLSAPRVGASRSGLDDRAKSAGFHKLKKLGQGEYEKQY